MWKIIKRSERGKNDKKGKVANKRKIVTMIKINKMTFSTVGKARGQTLEEMEKIIY